MEKCKYTNKCGGCKYIGTEYEKELAEKQKYIESLLKPICKVEKIIPSEKRLNYRNKVHAVISGDNRGNIYAGTYEEGTHNVVDIEKCFLDNKKADAIIRTIVDLMKSFKYKPYDEDRGRGFLRHVLVRTADATGEIMVTLVVGETIFPSKNNFIKALLKEHPEITTVVMNINSRRTSMVLGNKEQVLYGKGYINDILLRKKFKLSSRSFYQVNHSQTEKLYSVAYEYAGLTGKEKIIDAYSGIGTIGICASDKAASVTGIELNADAVNDAKINVKLNGITGANYVVGDAGDYMEREAAKGVTADVVFMDPPRSGSTEKFIDSICKIKPQKVIYISCGPESLARDLKYFKKKGFKAVKCQPVDMFSGTGHVETVCLLSKLHEAKHHVNVKLDMDEMDITSAESKTTYEEIKKYVAEHNGGMKVSNLYIAQVKSKYEIIERDNSNKPKSEKAKQPLCPKEKENAIVEALKAFKMI